MLFLNFSVLFLRAISIIFLTKKLKTYNMCSVHGTHAYTTAHAMYAHDITNGDLLNKIKNKKQTI